MSSHASSLLTCGNTTVAMHNSCSSLTFLVVVSAEPWSLLANKTQTSDGETTEVLATEDVKREAIYTAVSSPGTSTTVAIPTFDVADSLMPNYATVFVALYPLEHGESVTPANILSNGIEEYKDSIDFVNAQQLSFGVSTCAASSYPGPKSVSGLGQTLVNQGRDYVVTTSGTASYTSTPNTIALSLLDLASYKSPSGTAINSIRKAEDQEFEKNKVITYTLIGVLVAILLYFVAHFVFSVKKHGFLEPSEHHYKVAHEKAMEHHYRYAPPVAVQGSLT